MNTKVAKVDSESWCLSKVGIHYHPSSTLDPCLSAFRAEPFQALSLDHAPPTHLYSQAFRFCGVDISKYAILSHTWGKAEVALQELQNFEAEQLDRLEGYVKIRARCALAASNRYEHVWTGTCCAHSRIMQQPPCRVLVQETTETRWGGLRS